MSLLSRARRAWGKNRGEERGRKAGSTEGGKPAGGVEGRSKRDDKKKSTRQEGRIWEEGRKGSRRGRRRKKGGRSKKGKERRKVERQRKSTKIDRKRKACDFAEVQQQRNAFSEFGEARKQIQKSWGRWSNGQAWKERAKTSLRSGVGQPRVWGDHKQMSCSFRKCGFIPSPLNRPLCWCPLPDKFRGGKARWEIAGRTVVTP